jgi:hypothetical protein
MHRSASASCHSRPRTRSARTTRGAATSTLPALIPRTRTLEDRCTTASRRRRRRKIRRPRTGLRHHHATWRRNTRHGSLRRCSNRLRKYRLRNRWRRSSGYRSVRRNGGRLHNDRLWTRHRCHRRRSRHGRRPCDNRSRNRTADDRRHRIRWRRRTWNRNDTTRRWHCGRGRNHRFRNRRNRHGSLWRNNSYRGLCHYWRPIHRRRHSNSGTRWRRGFGRSLSLLALKNGFERVAWLRDM